MQWVDQVPSKLHLVSCIMHRSMKLSIAYVSSSLNTCEWRPPALKVRVRKDCCLLAVLCELGNARVLMATG